MTKTYRNCCPNNIVEQKAGFYVAFFSVRKSKGLEQFGALCNIMERNQLNPAAGKNR